jgi:hypothetical protein
VAVAGVVMIASRGSQLLSSSSLGTGIEILDLAFTKDTGGVLSITHPSV